MALRKPTAQDKLAYFTKRVIGSGKIMIWRFEGEDLFNIEYVCPNCGKSGEQQKELKREKVSIKNEAGKSKRVNAFIIKCDFCGADIIVEQWAKAGPGRKRKV
ncbi:MAG: hypothetical protein ACP5IJ_01055 [Candidatus Nanoarchaeia archaeon]